MLTGLKVSSLPCKCVFNRPEHNAKEGPHKTVNLKVLNLTHTRTQTGNFFSKLGLFFTKP